MKTLKMLILIFLCLVLVNVVLAQENVSDYSNPDSYKSNQFYQTSNPAKWDYSVVDWTMVPSSQIQNVPVDDLDYSKLSPVQKKAMSVDQVSANLNSINDLSADVNKDAAQKAIKQKYSVDIDIGSGASIKNDVLSTNSGFQDHVSLSAESYKNGKLQITSDGRIIFTPNENSASIDISQADSVSIDTNKKELKFNINSQQVPISGKISFKDGQMQVDKGDFATIYNTYVESTKDDVTTSIFFDGKEKESIGNYVSFDLSKRRVVFGTSYDDGGGLHIIFYPDNPFVKMQKDDKLSMSLKGPGTISIKNREDEGLIPEMNIKANFDKNAKGGVLFLADGRAGLRFSQNEGVRFLITGRGVSESGTTVPLSMVLNDQQGNSVLGTKDEPKKLILSRFDELATVPLTATEGLTKISETYDFAPSKVSERLDINYREYTVDWFEQQHPGITISGDLDSATIKRISDTLNALPPVVSHSISGFEVYSADDYKKSNIGVERSQAWTTTDGIIRLRLDYLNENIIYHEAAHDLTYEYNSAYLDSSSSQFINERSKIADEKQISIDEVHFLDENGKSVDPCEKRDSFSANSPCVCDETSGCHFKVDAFSKRNGVKVDLDPETTLRIKEVYLNSYDRDTSDSFSGQWESIQADGRGLLSGYSKSDPKILQYSSETTNEPKYGFVRPYGAVNLKEDIASFVEKVNVDPAFYKPLITPSSPQYDERYVKKLQLLCEYEFITKEKCTSIFG